MQARRQPRQARANKLHQPSKRVLQRFQTRGAQRFVHPHLQSIEPAVVGDDGLSRLEIRAPLQVRLDRFERVWHAHCWAGVGGEEVLTRVHPEKGQLRARRGFSSYKHKPRRHGGSRRPSARQRRSDPPSRSAGSDSLFSFSFV